MGNGVGKLNLCFAGDAGEISRRRHHISVYLSDPLDDGLGHSFCYFPQDSSLLSSSSSTTTFKSISGASLSANTTTPLSTSLIDLSLYNTASLDKASSFQSSDSFASIPLQPIPRNSIPSVRSSPIPPTSGAIPSSGPIERGFLSGPIERNFISGPLENQYDHLQRYKPNYKKWDMIRNLKKTIARVASGKVSDWTNGLDKNNENGTVNSGKNFNRQVSLVDDCDESFKSMNVQWAQGKAGEDRVHIVIPEEQGWVFVGIYDGFNGPDATDYLLNNLYSNVHQELNGLLCNNKSKNDDPYLMADHMFDKCLQCSETEDHPCGYGDLELYCDSRTKRRKKSKQKWEERLELGNLSNLENVGINHSDILKALSVALRKTEESFLEIADTMLPENPELSLMGSCVLVMLMKGEDVYLMNVGDSRAVLARKSEPDLASINEENLNDFEAFDCLPNLISLQLTMDHSTSVEEEVKRIKKEHHSDSSAISNDRVKGSLKVTRAFGAGFLKQPKWNNALLEMFRIDYVGSSPYITCSPSLYHHRLGPRDRFLILSSDGLYQYFTNEEAISEVEVFTSSFPEGDPAQHLVEEVLFRAAKKAGMDFHELLDIPQGDRRRYHDDVSIIIISFEGKIWRSSV